jgi:hypothetical protein
MTVQRHAQSHHVREQVEPQHVLKQTSATCTHCGHGMPLKLQRHHGNGAEDGLTANHMGPLTPA